MMTKKITTLVAAGIAAIAAAAASAQTFPSKPVSLVVPYAAGGSTETMARVFAKALSDELGQPVLVNVRPGAGGAIGATEVAKSEADGYTILFAASSALLWPPMTQEVEYDLDSFSYVAKLSDFQQAIVASADAPFSTMEELVAYSKDHKLSYGDQSTLSRAFIDNIAKQEGVEWNGIPTKGGGEMVPFLLGGKIDFAWSGGVHANYGDKMKVLLSMNATRLGASPDVPSIQEVYGISMPSQAVLVVPTGTPEDVINLLAEKSQVAMQNAEFVDLMTNKLLFPLSFASPADITAEIADSVAALEKVKGDM